MVGISPLLQEKMYFDSVIKYLVSNPHIHRKINTCTINYLKIRTPQKFAVITLKFEQSGFTTE